MTLLAGGFVSSRLGRQPVASHTDVDAERGIERERVDHLLAHELTDRRDLDLGHLEQQLVVDLQDELAPPFPRRAGAGARGSSRA